MNNIFKKYDIRGKYPEEINPTSIKKVIDVYTKNFTPQKVVIGHDAVEGAGHIADVITSELQKKGISVIRIGLVATPRLAFASAHLNIKNAIMVTASHLGIGYTGIKFLIDGLPPTAKQVEKLSNEYDHFLTDTKDNNQKTDNIELFDITQPYIDAIKSITGVFENKYKIVIDNSNGPNGNVIQDLLTKLNLEAIIINKKIDGANPAHGTNPKEEETRLQLVKKVKSLKADLGIIWDGDCDRAYFIDSEGVVIPPEFIGIIISKFFFKKNLMTTMTVDVRGSRAVETELQKIGGIVKRIQAWNIPIKFEMLKDKNIGFGMETSGHYVFRDFYRIDDGLLASMIFVKALEQENSTLGSLLSEFRSKYYIVEEINFKTDKSETTIIEELKNKYSDGEIDFLDGISIDYPTWRCNVRASKTEPIIRLNISGTNKDTVNKKLSEISRLIKS